MTSLYENDFKVGALTREAFERTGSRLLQIHRFGHSITDEPHVEKLLKIFDPKLGQRIADVGCGVGRLAELMQKRRPDLDFILINISLAQLAMCPLEFERRMGTAEKLPLARGAVGALMATYVLGHVDLGQFVDECRRVLNPGSPVYVYDIFKEDPAQDCRLATDLGYAERTVDEMEQAFAAEGFKARTAQAYSWYVPKEIADLMPSGDTLKNTWSAAIAFDKQ